MKLLVLTRKLEQKKILTKFLISKSKLFLKDRVKLEILSFFSNPKIRFAGASIHSIFPIGDRNWLYKNPFSYLLVFCRLFFKLITSRPNLIIVDNRKEYKLAMLLKKLFLFDVIYLEDQTGDNDLVFNILKKRIIGRIKTY